MNIQDDNFIPQANPKADYLAHKDEIDAAVQDVLDSGWYILGRNVETFEREFAAFNNVGFGVGVASGTDALEIALRALDIGPGDLIFTVSHTAVATIAAILRCGAAPVLVDVDQTSFNIEPNRLGETVKAINDGRLSIPGCPRAIIPVHLYGQPANMDAVMDIAHRYDLEVIEDCAQAHGAKFSGRSTGSFGQMGAFSFYPTKNLGAIGDGGMVITNIPKLQQKLIALREYGWEKRYVSVIPGINSRLDEMQAAILQVKLRHLNGNNERRREIATAYTNALRKTKISTPCQADNTVAVYHQYVVKTKNRDDLVRHLKENEIGAAIHYPVPVHLQPAYKDNVYIEQGGLAVTEMLCREIISLPIYPQMTDVQVERVADVLLSWKMIND